MKLDWKLQSLGNGPLISTSLTHRETAELQRLARDTDVLEIGSAYGYSAIAMALHGARVTAIDPHIWLQSKSTMEQNLLAYGVNEKVKIIDQWSHDVLPLMKDEKFGLIWIDGDHSETAVTRDLTLSKPLLRAGGVIACHDYGEDTCPEVKVTLDKIMGPPHQLTDTLAVYYWTQM